MKRIILLLLLLAACTSTQSTPQITSFRDHVEGILADRKTSSGYVAARFEELVRAQLEALGEDPDRDGLRETPERVAHYWKVWNSPTSNFLKPSKN